MAGLWLRCDKPPRHAPKARLKFYPDAPNGPRPAGVTVDDPLLLSVLRELSQPLKQFRPLAELFERGVAAPRPAI